MFYLGSHHNDLGTIVQVCIAVVCRAVDVKIKINQLVYLKCFYIRLSGVHNQLPNAIDLYMDRLHKAKWEF